MTQLRISSERAAALLIVIVYAVGTVGHLLPATARLMVSLTPLVLGVFGAVVFGFSAARAGRLLLIWAGATYAITFALEAVGTATGAVFGSYSYGDVLGLKLFHVPVVIGFNWVIVVLGAVTLAGRLTSSDLLASLYAGLFAVVFDLVLEPVAVALRYWRWDPGQSPAVRLSSDTTVPLLNFAAWFVISAAAAFWYRSLRFRRQSYLPIVYLGVQLLFFSVVFMGVLV